MYRCTEQRLSHPRREADPLPVYGGPSGLPKEFLERYAAIGVRFRGVFVENKSGRQAVRAKVAIDDTGEADLARRAGLPVLQPKREYSELDPHAPNGMAIWAVLGG